MHNALYRCYLNTINILPVAFRLRIHRTLGDFFFVWTRDRVTRELDETFRIRNIIKEGFEIERQIKIEIYFYFFS